MNERALVRGRRAFWLTFAAFAWGAALVVAAFVVPVSGAQTLVAQNGPHVLFVIGAPVVIAALVWVALHHRCSRGGVVGGYLAWTLIAILIAGCMLGIASVGLFMAPAAVLLARAAALTPQCPSAV